MKQLAYRKITVNTGSMYVSNRIFYIFWSCFAGDGWRFSEFTLDIGNVNLRPLEFLCFKFISYFLFYCLEIQSKMNKIALLFALSFSLLGELAFFLFHSRYLLVVFLIAGLYIEKE